jgi:murein DD-endopeptidase MepM/ murein hydrolase activator NlpD
MAFDIANNALPPVWASDAGTVVAAGWDSTGYGNRIIVDHNNGYQTLYGHLSQISVAVGQAVSRGQTIGRMGSTGRSTGPHLHFEVRQGGRQLNPALFVHP